MSLNRIKHFAVAWGLASLIAAPGLMAQDEGATPVAPIDLAQAAQSAEGVSLVDKASMLIGFNVVSNMKRQGVDINLEKLIEGIKLAESGGELPMDDKEVQSVMMAFQREMQKKAMAKREKEAADNMEKGKAFLAENAKKEGIQMLDDGLQYQVIKTGDASGANPAKTDFVKVFYTGTLTDGTKFDGTSPDKPARFNCGGVIRGFSAALQAMRPGDKWKVFIPSDLAYGKRGSPPRIGPNSVLIFEIELVEIEAKKTPASDEK